MDDLLREFLAESTELLGRLDREIVALEQAPEDQKRLQGIFRTVHTIKGTCGLFGFARLESVAHAAESVLDRLRSGELAAEPEIVSDVLAAVDVIRSIVEALEERGTEPRGDDRALIARLERWAAAGPGAEGAGDAPGPAVSPELPRADAPASPRRAADATLRVSVEILDQLMNLAGELMLTRNQLHQLAQEGGDARLAVALQSLDRISDDLQGAVMKTRLQPIGSAWGKLPRLVRDLCQANGKKVHLVLAGAETELDRQILQAIQDPLTHMIRNSVAHGIELPVERQAAGKPETGIIHLAAFQERRQIVVEIRDDGRGLDAEAIRSGAVAQGLVRPEVAEGLSDAQLFPYIFEPGFSTAATVTSVCGRGVGMDVVRSNIERVGGTIELASIQGRGTTIRLRIPLTLAILPALLVETGGHCFAIPQGSVAELVRLPDSGQTPSEAPHEAGFFRLHDTLLPLVELQGLLGLPGSAGEARNLVVCQAGAQRFALVVDRILDTREIVLKPIGRLVRHVPLYSGSTILADGRVVMILDVPGLEAAARLAERAESGATPAAPQPTPPVEGERTPGLVSRSDARSRQNGTRRRVLLVDDSPVFLNVIGPALREGKWDVALAADGREALARLEQGERFDAILSDLDMPRIDGYELARRVSRHPGWRQIPLLALTGRYRAEDRLQALQTGFRGFLRKFDRAEVLSALEELTDSDAVSGARGATGGRG